MDVLRQLDRKVHTMSAADVLQAWQQLSKMIEDSPAELRGMYADPAQLVLGRMYYLGEQKNIEPGLTPAFRQSATALISYLRTEDGFHKASAATHIKALEERILPTL